MSSAAKAVQAARFLSGMYRERARVLYWAHVRGDLFSRLILPNHHTDPYQIYEEMRAQGPLLPTRLGNYTTTSHRLCNEVLRSRRFGVRPEDGSEDLANQAGLDLSLLELNPPDHTRIRRLAAPAFTPRRMAGYVTLVDQAIQGLLEQCERECEFDLMTSFASPLPIAVVTHLLGLPNDPERLRRLGSTIAQALDGIWSLAQARTLAAADAELRTTFATLLDRRRVNPGNDLVSALVAEQGKEITAAELSALVRLLLIAGFETTVNAIGNGMHWLLADREQWDLLVKDPGRAPAVVEEVLRFDPPVQQTARVANQPTEVGNVLVRKNQWVITLLAAANRDPDTYPEPNRFDITRESPVEHLAFSGGIHYCLGSPLARLELTQAFRALAERFPRIRQTAPITMRPGTTLRGPLRFPVAVS
ncbi:MAG TPA: cytochrome P450 [Propionibacteriaceae bacterium]|nr:cytochrome P450 [Propionibacteriaceae bacterium]